MVSGFAWLCRTGRHRGSGPGRDAAGHRIAPCRAPRRRPANPSSLNRGSNRYHSRCSLTPLAAVLRSLRFFLLGDHLGTTRHTYARTNRRWLPVVHGQLDASELRRRLLPRSGGQGVAGSNPAVPTQVRGLIDHLVLTLGTTLIPVAWSGGS